MAFFLTNKEMWDMPLAGNGDEKHIPHWFGNIVFWILSPILKILFRYRVDGRASLRGFKGKSGVVVICNHTSFLDVCFMYFAARWQQWIRLIGRDSLFEKAHGLLGQILSRVGAFPIKRDSADRTAIKRAVRFLNDGELIGIMPEGTRRGKGNLDPTLHSGAAFIANRAKVPILPCTVRNAELVKQKGKFIRFPKITIEFGLPILVEDFDFIPKADRYDACSWYAMRQCFAMFYQVDPKDVNMVKLFPNNKDFTQLFADNEIPVHTTDEIINSINSGKSMSYEIDLIEAKNSAEITE